MRSGDAVDAFLEALPASVEPATRGIARRAAELRARHPTTFLTRGLTYGIGVSLKAMLDPVAARAHVPIT